MKVLNLIPMKNVHMMKAAALILAAGLKTMPPAARGRRGERSGTGWSRCVFDGRELSDSYGSDSFLYISDGKKCPVHIQERSC